MEQDEDWVSVSTSLQFPITENGSGFIQGLWGGYRPLEHLGVGAGFSYAVAPSGELSAGNLRLGLDTGIRSKYKKGFGAYLDGDLDLGLGLFESDESDPDIAAEMGKVADVGWLRFMTGSAVIQSSVGGGVRLNRISLYASVGPVFAIPLTDLVERDSRIAIAYWAGMGFGFGDHRGGIGFSVGGKGLAELTLEEDHSFAIAVRVRMWFGSHGLRPYVKVRFPVAGPSAGIYATVSAGLSWKFDVSGREPSRKAG